MKTQIKRFSKSTLAVVLTLCMLFSCVTVGIVATNAAQTLSESTGATTKVYFRNNDNWSNVYILTSTNINSSITDQDSGSEGDIWGSDLKSATAMTLVPGETKVYQADITLTNNRVVFVSAKSKEDGYLKDCGNCVARFDYAAGKIVNAWDSSNNNNKVDERNSTKCWKSNLEDYTPPTDVTFYVCNSDSWDNVCAHLYGGTAGASAWPGTTLTPLSSSYYVGTYKDKPVYKMTVKTNCPYIIVNNDKDKQYNDGVQLVNNKLYYTTNVNKPSSIGSVDNFSDSMLDKTVTVSAGTNGKFSDNTTANKTVAANATNTYAGTLPTVVAPDGYEFDSWTTSSSGITINNADKNDGTATVNATAAGTVTATYKASSVTYTLYYRTGSDAFSPVDISSFTATLSLQAGKSYEYYIQKTSGGNNWYFKSPKDNDYMTRGNTTGWMLQNNVARVDSHTYVTADETGSYTFRLYNENDTDIYLDVTYPAKSQEYWLTGWINGEAKTNAPATTNRKFSTSDGGTTYTAVLPISATGNQYVTVYDGDNTVYHAPTENATTGTSSVDTTGITGRGDASTANENNKWMVETTDGDTVTFTWTPGSRTLSWSVSSVSNDRTLPRVVGSSSFFTSDWDTKTGDSEYDYTMTSGTYNNINDGNYNYKSSSFTANSSTSFEYKVFNPVNNGWYPNDNVQVSIQRGATITFYYNSSTGAVTHVIDSTGVVSEWPPSDINQSLLSDDHWDSLIYNISNGSNNITTDAHTLSNLKGYDNKSGWWADLSDLLGSVGANNLYFNITNNGNYTGFYAHKDSHIILDNAPGVTAEITNKDSKYYFVAVTGIDSQITNLGVHITKADESGKNNVFTYTFYSIKGVPDTSNVKVYAKDGAIRRVGTPRNPGSNITYSYFEQHANTFVYSDASRNTHIGTRTSTHGASGTESNTEYSKYTYDYVDKFEKGKTIYIKTQLDDTIKSTHYVVGYCINGTVYNLLSPNDTGVYTDSFTVPEDWDDDYVEITPIYFLKDDSNTLTFYVEGYDKTVQDAGWGNTVGVYPYYQDANNNQVANINNAYGGYPGQPLVFYKGNYYAQLPKSISAVTEAGGATTTCSIKGITLSNMYWDDVHLYTGEVSGHFQTYDFDDLYKIYNEYKGTNDVDNIICAFKYRSAKNNDEPNNLSTSDYSKYTNGWELLTNYQGEAIDIFGNVLTNQTDAKAKTVDSSGVVHVISQDYKDNCAGKYATEWAVYNTSGTKITGGGKNTIVPSALAIKSSANFSKYDKQTQAFKGIYEALATASNNVVNKPVFITYEKSIYGGGDAADRCDARWYFSKKKQSISASVRIEYSNDLGKTWTTDNFTTGTATGQDTGIQAYFTGTNTAASDTPSTALNNTTTTTQTGTIGGGYYTFNTKPDQEGTYEFVGWYIERDNLQLNVDKNYYNDKSGDALYRSHAEMAKNGDVFVARYMKSAHGSFTINHEMHPQSTGFGDVYVKAVVKDYMGNTKKQYGYDTNVSHITIPTSDGYISSNQGYTIEATFTADPYGTSDFTNFYATVADLLDGFNKYDYIKSISVDTANKTATVIYDVDKLFNAGSGEVAQKVTSVTHYSKFDLKSSVNYHLTYRFKTRYYGYKVYTYNQEFTEKELKSYFYDQITDKSKQTITLDKQFVYSKAPFESNYREDLVWDIEKIKINGNQGELDASQTPITEVKATIYDINGNGDIISESRTATYMQLFKDRSGELYEPHQAEYNNAPVYIHHWNIYSTDSFALETNQNGDYAKAEDGINLKVKDTSKLVAQSYSSHFNYVGYEDYNVVPVYTTENVNRQEISDNLSESKATLLTISRNHWNGLIDSSDAKYTVEIDEADQGKYSEPNTEYDRIYVDFVLSYNYQGKLLSSFKDNNDIVVGFKVKSYRWVSDGANTTTSHKDYTNKYDTVIVDKAKIDNKNRIEYCYGFKNTQNNSQWGLNYEFEPFIIDTTQGTVTDGTENSIKVKINNTEVIYRKQSTTTTVLDQVNFYMIGKENTPWN